MIEPRGENASATNDEQKKIDERRERDDERV